MQFIWLIIFFSVFTWSGLHPKDYPTWMLETAPAAAAFIAIAATRRRFPLTPLAYWLILIHSVILMIGGHYTYAEVPFFDFLTSLHHSSRNNYDKIGHLAQGFVPAIIAREILIRNAVVNGGRWLNFIVACICLAISAVYELIEWWVAIFSDEGAEAFLGTQGYVWDTQSDMAHALVGAVVSLAVLSRLHDRQLSALNDRKRRGYIMPAA